MDPSSAGCSLVVAARASSFSYNARWEVATAVAPHELSLKLVPGNRQDSAIFNLNSAWDAAAAKDSRISHFRALSRSIPLSPTHSFLLVYLEKLVSAQFSYCVPGEDILQGLRPSETRFSILPAANATRSKTKRQESKRKRKEKGNARHSKQTASCADLSSGTGNTDSSRS